MNFYLQSFLIFLKIGLFTIGGGYAMVPLIQDEIVDKRKWIDKEDFIDPRSVCTWNICCKYCHIYRI